MRSLPGPVLAARRAARPVLLGVALTVPTLLATGAAQGGEPVVPHAPATAAPLAISREVALRMAVERGPTVREARAPAAASASIRDAASGLLPYAPRVSVFAGRREGAFGSGLELGGSLTQDLSLRGLGSARRETAEAVDRSTRHTIERARLEAAAAALLAWLDVLEAQQLLELRNVARLDAEEIARVANARVARGLGMPSEASLAAAEIGAAALAEHDAEGHLFETRAMLKFAIGLPPTADVVAIGTLEGEEPSSLAPPPRREHPAEAAARSHVVQVEAEAKLARAQASTPFGVGVNYAREGTGEQYLTGTLSFPLPVLDPTRFDAARQHANVLAAEAHATRVRDELARDDALTTHERAHTREVRETLRTRVLVPLRETVRLARASYQAGTQDATSLLLLRQRLVSAEEQLGRAVADVRRADVRGALARGTLLDEVAR